MNLYYIMYPPGDFPYYDLGKTTHKPAPAPAKVHHNAPMPDKGARVMHDKGHNMGNHNAHKAPNREIAMNTRTNHGGSGHFSGRR